ncbi:hypothetical protein D3C84_1038520 [compost metagenome]
MGLEAKIGGEKGGSPAHHQRSLYPVFQLTNIARPVMLEHAFQRARTHIVFFAGGHVGMFFHEVDNERLYLFHSLAQRWDGQRQDIQPIEEVFAK